MSQVTRYDPGKARRAVRQGKERGVRVFIPADVLREAGIDPSGPIPTYKTWAGRRGSVLVRLYR